MKLLYFLIMEKRPASFYCLLLSLFIAFPVLAEGRDIVSQAFDSGERMKYLTKGHPKSKGIDLSIEYPSDWKAEEGERPNIVQKFSGDANDGVTKMCLILIKDSPQEASLMSDEDLAKEEFSEEALKEMVSGLGVFISGKQTKYDGQRGAWVIYLMDSERAGITAKMYTLQHMFFYERKMISIQCTAGGLEQMKGSIYQEFNKYIPLFQQIGNSIIIQDKWEKVGDAEPSTTEYLYGPLWWLTIIVSLVLTWGIGLIPPVIVRYVIVKRPFSKPWAIGFVVFFWMVNIVVFTALGSQNKTHAALFLVAYVSYVILCRKNKREDSE